jgi:hypothetical protein
MTAGTKIREKLAAFEARIEQLTDDTRRTEGQHDQLVLELTDLADARSAAGCRTLIRRAKNPMGPGEYPRGHS